MGVGPLTLRTDLAVFARRTGPGCTVPLSHVAWCPGPGGLAAVRSCGPLYRPGVQEDGCVVTDALAPRVGLTTNNPTREQSSMSNIPQRKRAKAHELRAQGKSIREIAAALGVGKSTVGDWLQAPPERLAPVPNLQTDGGKPVAGADEGNTRAVTHGAYSPAVWGPIADDIAAEIEQGVEHTPAAHPIFAAARYELAKAMAQSRLIARHKEENCGGLPFDRKTGAVFGFAEYELKLTRTISQCLSDLGMTPAAAAKLNLHVARAEGEAARMQREQREREARRREALLAGSIEGQVVAA